MSTSFQNPHSASLRLYGHAASSHSVTIKGYPSNAFQILGHAPSWGVTPINVPFSLLYQEFFPLASTIEEGEGGGDGKGKYWGMKLTKLFLYIF